MSSKKARRQKRFSNYAPEDFDQKVPFLVRKIEVEEDQPQDDGKRDSLAEAVKIYWTNKGGSEEELIPSIEELDEENLDENLLTEVKKISDSTVEESISLYSYVPEPEIIEEPEIVEVKVEEKKPKKKKDRNKISEPMENTEGEAVVEVKEEPEEVPKEDPEEPEEELEENLEVESLSEDDMAVTDAESVSKVEDESEPELVEMSEVESLSKLEEESEMKSDTKCETETVPELEQNSVAEAEKGDEASVFSEGEEYGELVVETEEIKLEVKEPPKVEETDEEDQTPSYTWLLGPTSDEVILDVVEFFTHILTFVQDPIRFGHRNRECCKKIKVYPSEAGDGTDSGEE